jgi:hypothetical protein
MSTRHTFAAALVLLLVTLAPALLGIAQDKKPEASETAAPCNRIPADADERERKIYEALSRPTDINFEEKPLKDVVEKLATTSGIQIQFDEKALSEAAVATDTAITKRLRGISLRSTLRILLRPLQLTYVIRNGVLLITSQTEAENHQIVRIYPVRDLVSPPDVPNAAFDHLDFDPLIDLITAVVAPQTWDTVGGPGAGKILPPGLLAFSQTIEVHDEIAALLDGLRRARDMQKKTPGGPPVLLCDEAPILAIHKALDQAITVDVGEQPLAKVVSDIAHKANMQVVFDEKALTEAGVATDTPITKTIKDIPLRDTLDLILRPLQLTHIIRDEVLMITSQVEAENLLSIRLYPVQDLVRLVPAEEARYGAREYDFDLLIDAITASISAQSWDTVGGRGSIQPFEHSMALGISQTDEVHGRIENLLAQIRRTSSQVADATSQQTKIAESNEPILRVYTRYDRVRKIPHGWRAEGTETMPPKEKHEPQKATNRSDTQPQLRQLGIGGGYEGSTFQRCVESQIETQNVPPQGVSAAEAANLIRSLIKPDSWNSSDVSIHASDNYLVVQQTPDVHRQISRLLERLGPWYEDPRDGFQFMQLNSRLWHECGGLAGGMGAGSAGAKPSTSK